MAKLLIIKRDFFFGVLMGITIGILMTNIYREFTLEINGQPLWRSYLFNSNNSNVNILTRNIDEVYKGNEKAIAFAKSIRILCLVLVQPSSYTTKGQAVKDTWGKRCNILLLISSKNDTKFGTIGLDVPEGRKNLWMKTRDAFKYAYEHYYDKVDWFIKADDDTFLIVENLRYFLMSYNTSDGHYFGSKCKGVHDFNGGGASYVLSKKALKDFNHVMNDSERCSPTGSGAEDYYVAKCLSNFEIYPGDTRDQLGRHTFHQLTLENEFFSNNKKMIWKSKQGRECCSDYSISYHHIKEKLMYQFDYLIYNFRVYGNDD